MKEILNIIIFIWICLLLVIYLIGVPILLINAKINISQMVSYYFTFIMLFTSAILTFLLLNDD